MKTIPEGARVIHTATGAAGSVVEAGDPSLVLFDAQRPSSEPKPVPLDKLRVVSEP